MSIDLEHRVDNLEKEIDDLKKAIGISPGRKDWRKTFGMSQNDPGFDEMIQFGRDIRERDREEDA